MPLSNINLLHWRKEPSMPGKAFKVVVAGLVLAGAVVLLCWRVAPLLEEKPQPKPQTPKKEVPIDQRVEAIGVSNLDGRPSTLADLVAQGAGKPIVVAFWSVT